MAKSDHENRKSFFSFRVTVGGLISLGWIAAAAFYLAYVVGWDNFVKYDANQFGDFLAGVAAPLAFLWFVLGYFQQSEELRLQRRELELQRSEIELQRLETKRLADQAMHQTESIAANEMHARRDVFFKLRSLIEESLRSHAARILSLLFTVPQMRSVYDGYQNGDRDIFFRELTSNFLHGRHDETKEKLRGVMEGENFVAKYCEEFEALLRDVDLCDPDKSIRRIIEYSAMGDLYWVLGNAYDREMRYSERAR